MFIKKMVCSECRQQGLQCPQCKKIVRCYYHDIGETDYRDQYILHCHHCGFLEAETILAGKPSSNDGYLTTVCPFCGDMNDRHDTPPAEVIDKLEVVEKKEEKKRERKARKQRLPEKTK